MPFGHDNICMNDVVSFVIDNLVGRVHPMVDDCVLSNLSLLQHWFTHYFFCYWAVQKWSLFKEEEKETLEDKKYVQAKKKKENVGAF